MKGNPMGLLDDIQNLPQQNVVSSTVKPSKGRFIKEGYLDWDNPKHANVDPNDKQVREALGVILPPYPTYLAERIAAAKAGVVFDKPFWLRIGNHGLGAKAEKSKVYCLCSKTLIEDNKVNQGYPMLSPDLDIEKNRSCPICDACWDLVWPEVKAHEGNKDSPEYKTFKDAHRQTCPQQKYVFNFLPAGSDKPVLLEVAKTLGDAIISIHYDSKQPDLLWPYTVGTTFQSCWIQLKRTDRPDTTAYTASPCYIGAPHIINPSTKVFDEALYALIMTRIQDLREVSKKYIPSKEDLDKGMIKCQQILAFRGINIARANMAAVEQATAGVPGASATPAPTMPPTIVVSTTPAPTPVPVPPAAVSSVPTPPMITPAGAAPAAVAVPPAAPAPTPDNSKAFEMLQGLLGQPTK